MIWRNQFESRNPGTAMIALPQAVFFDRDGTLIEHVPYLCRTEEVVLRPGTREAVARLQAAAVKLFLFTNQSGVARGLFGMSDVEAVNRRMIELLDLGPSPFTDICIAPELPGSEAGYRKPSPRFIDEMLSAHGIARGHAWMIGDSPVDWEAGINAGILTAAIVAHPDAGKEPMRRQELGISAFPTLLDWLEAVSGVTGSR